MSHLLTHSNKKVLFTTGIQYNNKTILPLVEGVMVDDHTGEKISHSGKRISPETKSSLSSYNRVKCLES